MNYIKSFILIAFTTLSIISIIELSTQAKGADEPTSEPTRIEAPKAVCKDEHIEVDTVEIGETVAHEEPQTEVIEVEIKAEQVEAPALDLMWDLPIRAEVQLEIEAMCAARDIDTAIVVAIIYHESRYDEKAIGDNGKAFGLMQIQPRWHQDRIDRLGVTDLLDGSQNVVVGIDYLDELLDIYNQDYGKALTAYNQGHYRGTVSAYAITIMEEAKTWNMK